VVRVVDEGSHFDAPIAKLWKLIEIHARDAPKIHPGLRNVKFQTIGENQALLTCEAEVDGNVMPIRLRLSSFPPLAQVVEVLQGPLAGSKVINYYTPKGDKTAVTAIGEFESSVLPPDRVEAAAREFLRGGFEDDQAYLKKMR
jgi:hypothetical protein